MAAETSRSGGDSIFGKLGVFVARWPWLVIGIWAVLALVFPLTIPSLNEMSQRNPVALLPADAPSTVTARQMTAAFNETGSDNLVVILLTDDKGLSAADERVYQNLIDKLRQDTSDVVMLQDFLSAPPLRETLESKDKQSWIIPVGLSGELGTPRSYEAFTHVAEIVKRTVDGTSLTANLTGPASTVADMTDVGARDRLAIELAISVMLLVILAIIYRRPASMLLPLITIGASLMTAQALIAGVSYYFGLPISNLSIVLLSAMIAGAGTDYAVFLISRYHDYLRQGHSSEQALKRALASIGKVITASAATVGVTFVGMGFAKLGLFAKAGPALAIGIGVALLAAMTLLPAIMVLVGPRGWIDPRPERTAVFWRRMGVRIVRRPKVYLVSSLVILLALASCVSLLKYNYDERKQLPATAASSVGYAALDKHFPVNRTIPEYLFIQSPHDLRSPRALADLEQMVQRVSQVPGVAMIRGVTRPTGESLEEARATYQAGQVGTQLGGASDQITGRTNDLNKLAWGADKLADTLGDVRGQIKQAVGSVGSLVDALSFIEGNFGGSQTLGDLDKTAKLIASIRQLGDFLQVRFASELNNFEWIDPVVIALDTSPFCDINPLCAGARGQFHRLQAARDDGTLESIVSLIRQLQNAGPLQKLSTTVEGLSSSLKTIQGSLNKLGLGGSGNAKTKLITMQKGANDLASASRQVSDGVALLVDETKRMGLGLSEASAFLMEMGQDSSNPSMAGFNIPAQVLNSDDFKRLARAFISPDGRSVRYFIETDLNPFSTQAMDQINAIIDTARSAQPNTSLADARVSMSGYPVTLRDTRDYYDRDIRLLALITVAVVLLILTMLLRSIIAPLYLVGTVIVSCASAVGIGVILFQFILGQQLHWSVPGFAFVVLVAVGADYNMLLASRLREDSARGIRTGVIRTVRSTGGVITAAGLIFTASMSGLLFSSIGTVVQAGFVIGVGIMLDTFVVRTITVPAIATLLGRASWWPARPWLEEHESDDRKPVTVDSV